MIPKEKWQWFGCPLHLCVGHLCEFHLGTLVGKYVVSTVGFYRPFGKELEEVGCDRYGETYVFKHIGWKECGCPMIDLSEIDSRTFYRKL